MKQSNRAHLLLKTVFVTISAVMALSAAANTDTASDRRQNGVEKTLAEGHRNSQFFSSMTQGAAADSFQSLAEHNAMVHVAARNLTAEDRSTLSPGGFGRSNDVFDHGDHKGIDSWGPHHGRGFHDDRDSIPAVPEPETYGLLSVGLALVFAARWRKQRKPQ